MADMVPKRVRPNLEGEAESSTSHSKASSSSSNTQNVELEALDSNHEDEGVVHNEEIIEESIEERQRRTYGLARDRPQRVTRVPQRYGYADMISYALLADSMQCGEPMSYEEAMESEDSGEWQLAMKEEMSSLLKNHTWDLVEKPSGKKIVTCRWLYKRKDVGEDSKPRYKARLVARGFTQQKGVDYEEIFSPVVRHTSIRVLLSLVVQWDMFLEQMDVKTAFLHGELEESIYMSQPEGFAEIAKESLVCKLKKSLYGLKQSPRMWYQRFDSFMLQVGFIRSKHDACVYIKLKDVSSSIYLLLYVDDMLLASTNMEEIHKVKHLLKEEFEMKDLGAAKRILGMEIKWKVHGKELILSQGSYIEKVVKRYNMSGSKSVGTSFSPHFKLCKDLCPKEEEEKAYMQTVPYQNAVGSIMYAMVCCRPDLAYPLSIVSRFMANPGRAHWEATKWILRYLNGAKTVGLSYSKSEEDEALFGFVDSDYAGCLDTRRSLTGFVFMVFGNTISWKSRLQPVVALSTTEAEYMAAVDAVKEAIWLKGLLLEMGVLLSKPVKIYCDNQSAVYLAKNPMFHERTKHIDIKFHYLKETVSSGVVSIVKIATEDNTSDVLTKALPNPKFMHCLNLMRMVREKS